MPLFGRIRAAFRFQPYAVMSTDLLRVTKRRRSRSITVSLWTDTIGILQAGYTEKSPRRSPALARPIGLAIPEEAGTSLV
jgi:hypothetical protein